MPTVLLNAGMVSFSSNWAWVQPEVAQVARVVAYDRAGLGWSDPGLRSRDAGHSARELHTALGKLGIAGPYVLAGHSYEGLLSKRKYARFVMEAILQVLEAVRAGKSMAHQE